MSVFEVPGPYWLDDGDMDSCETCGHVSYFSVGFEYNEEGYVQGWYLDEISCYDWRAYDSWLYGLEDSDTIENFRMFLSETDTEDAKQVVAELDRLGL